MTFCKVISIGKFAGGIRCSWGSLWLLVKAPGGTNAAHEAPYVAHLIRVSRRRWGNQVTNGVEYHSDANPIRSAKATLS